MLCLKIIAVRSLNVTSYYAVYNSNALPIELYFRLMDEIIGIEPMTLRFLLRIAVTA